MENYQNGEYNFILSGNDTFAITIHFTINDDGTVLYDEPTLAR